MPLGASIAVDNSVQEELASRASWVEVYERMGQPTSYRLRYEVEVGSSDFDHLVDSRLDAGSVLSVLVPGRSGNECLVKGPVGAQRIHLEHGGAGSYVEVRGSDTGIKMDREAQSKVWADVTDSQAVTTILGTYALTPQVTSTDGGHYENKHTLIQRESDLSFVRRLARRNGFLFWITCDALGVETGHFAPPITDTTPIVMLTINQNPSSMDKLDVRWEVERPTSVTGTQLDLNTQEDVDGSKQGTPLTALGGQDLSAITGDTRSIFVSAPSDDAGDLGARATGALVESHFFISATGETRLDRVGSPVRAHTILELRGAGSRHSGKYFVAGVRHTIDPENHRMELQLLRNAWGS